MRKMCDVVCCTGNGHGHGRLFRSSEVLDHVHVESILVDFNVCNYHITTTIVFTFTAPLHT